MPAPVEADVDSDSDGQHHADRPLRIAIVCGLLLLHGEVCFQTARAKTVTHDEIWHVPAGLRNLQGDFTADFLNPPVTRMWGALPLWIAGVSVPEDIRGSELGRAFAESHPDNFQSLYFRARMFNIAWSIATGLVLYLWCATTFGTASALLALLLYVTCPDVIAHASVMTSDIGMTFAFVVTLACLCRWTESLRWRDALLLGGALGLAQGIKYTAIILALLVPLIVGLRLFSRRRAWGRGAVQFGAVVVVSILVLGASYRFQGMFQPLRDIQFQSSTMQDLQKRFGELRLPLPADYLRGVDAQRKIMDGEHAVYLDRDWSRTGFRMYYLKALLYKLPHFTQLLIVTGLLALLARRGRQRPSSTGSILLSRFDRQPGTEVLTLLLPTAALITVASLSSMQLGLRYILPVFPMLLMIGGQTVRWLPPLAPLPFKVLIVGTVLACLAPLRYHPDHLAYFNELAGGPVDGRLHLIDSNLDWGQDLNQVRTYMEDNGIPSIGLAYFGTVPPALLGIDYTIPPSGVPEPGLYAVSVNFVMGRPHWVIRPDGTTRLVNLNEFFYFSAFEPIATLGGSIDIYEITAEDIPNWHKLMQSPERLR